MDARARSGILALCLLLLPMALPADPEQWREQGREAVRRAQDLDRSTRARNVILFVGDGMGVSTVTAARILEGQLRGEPGEENLLAFERMPHLALAKTYNTNQQVPDSAGTMTAMVTGVKTRAGVIALDESVRRGDWLGARGHELPTLIEQAEERGMATGVVTTTSVTHATPAAAYAHVPERNWENDRALPAEAREAGYPDIARQLIEFGFGDGIDVVLGGGRSHFLPSTTGADPEGDALSAVLAPGRAPSGGLRRDGRDLIQAWEAQDDALYVSTRAEWEAIDWDEAPRVLGLFDWMHLEFVAGAERPEARPPLEDLTARAIQRLDQNPAGYVLVVEAGRIDHAHHASSAFLALHETLELSRAVQAALDLVDLEETLVIVTSDHDHTLAMGGYPRRGNPILGLARGNDERGEPRPEPLTDGLGLPYTTLGYLNGPGWLGASSSQPQGPKRHPHYTRRWQDDGAGPRHDLGDHDVEASDYLQESAIPMVAETHAGHDVPIYAAGPGAHLFHGVQEQSYVYHVAADALAWRRSRSWLERLFGD